VNWYDPADAFLGFFRHEKQPDPPVVIRGAVLVLPLIVQVLLLPLLLSIPISGSDFLLG